MKTAFKYKKDYAGDVYRQENKGGRWQRWSGITHKQWSVLGYIWRAEELKRMDAKPITKAQAKKEGVKV